MLKKKQTKQSSHNIEKPRPIYLRNDYPYKSVGKVIEELNELVPTGVLYEIRCLRCGMCIRSQGVKTRSAYEHIVNGVEFKSDDGTVRIDGGEGCPGCGSRNLEISEVL